MKCFFFSDFLPNDTQIRTHNLQIDGEYTTSYIFEKDAENSVYDGLTAYRWVLDEPTDCSENVIHPGSEALIKFVTIDVIDDSIFHFVGWSSGALFGFN